MSTQAREERQFLSSASAASTAKPALASTHAVLAMARSITLAVTAVAFFCAVGGRCGGGFLCGNRLGSRGAFHAAAELLAVGLIFLNAHGLQLAGVGNHNFLRGHDGGVQPQREEK